MAIEISELLNNKTEFLSSQDLVDLGIYPSIAAAYIGRRRSNSPQWIKMKHKVLYPKKAVIQFLEQRIQRSENKTTSQGE